MTKFSGRNLFAVTGVTALVVGLVLGWLLHSTPSASRRPAGPSASSLASPSLAPDSGRMWRAFFDGVVVRAGDTWAVIKIDFGIQGTGLVRTNAVAWGRHRGSGIPLPPPAGTKVCALMGFTRSSLRTGVFDEAKVFVGSTCTWASERASVTG